MALPDFDEGSFERHQGRNVEKTYITKRFGIGGGPALYRFASKVFDSIEEVMELKPIQEKEIYRSPKGRSEIVVKFSEDTPGFDVLRIEQYLSGNKKSQLCLAGRQIAKLLNFLDNTGVPVRRRARYNQLGFGTCRTFPQQCKCSTSLR